MGEVTSASPQVTFDQQDPLPESSWGWRRGFTFVSSTVQAIGTALLVWMLYKIGEVLATERSVAGLLRIAGYLAEIARYLVILIVVDKVLYMIAPSAEQATKMIQTASMFKHGVRFRTSQIAETYPAGGATGRTVTEVTSEKFNERPVEGEGAASAGPDVAVPSERPDHASDSPAGSADAASAIPDRPPSER